MSDLEGKKPKTFLNFAKKNKLGFLALEYSGHGKSSGKFTNGNISIWTKETKLLINKVVKNNKIILVGSSMGAWISLNQFKFFKKKIIGFLGIGAAPEFLENLMWNKFSKKMKNEIKKNGIINLKHGDYEYPITLQLIKDGRVNKVLNKKIYNNLNVTMVHGSKDKSVPVSYSKKVLKVFKNSKALAKHIQTCKPKHDKCISINTAIDDNGEEYDLTIDDNGRVISASPINRLKVIELPTITIITETGIGALIKPIVRTFTSSPPSQDEIISVIDCV